VSADQVANRLDRDIGGEDEVTQRDDPLCAALGGGRGQSRPGEAPDDGQSRRDLDEAVHPESDERNRPCRDPGTKRDGEFDQVPGVPAPREESGPTLKSGPVGNDGDCAHGFKPTPLRNSHRRRAASAAGVGAKRRLLPLSQIGTDWIEPQPDAWMRGLTELSASLGIVSFVSHPERDATSGNLYNTLFVIGRDGQILGSLPRLATNPRSTRSRGPRSERARGTPPLQGILAERIAVVAAAVTAP
jgi:hypothetical protein